MGLSAPQNAGQETKLSGDYTTAPIALNDAVAGEAIWTANFLVGQGYTSVKHSPHGDQSQ